MISCSGHTPVGGERGFISIYNLSPPKARTCQNQSEGGGGGGVYFLFGVDFLFGSYVCVCNFFFWHVLNGLGFLRLLWIHKGGRETGNGFVFSRTAIMHRGC